MQMHSHRFYLTNHFFEDGIIDVVEGLYQDDPSSGCTWRASFPDPSFANMYIHLEIDKDCHFTRESAIDYVEKEKKRRINRLMTRLDFYNNLLVSIKGE